MLLFPIPSWYEICAQLTSWLIWIVPCNRDFVSCVCLFLRASNWQVIFLSYLEEIKLGGESERDFDIKHPKGFRYREENLVSSLSSFRHSFGLVMCGYLTEILKDLSHTHDSLNGWRERAKEALIKGMITTMYLLHEVLCVCLHWWRQVPPNEGVVRQRLW